MLQNQVLVVVNPDESARAVPQVAQVVPSIQLLILNDHMPLPDAPRPSQIALFLLLRPLFFVINDKIIDILPSNWILILRSYDGAPIFLLSLAQNQTLGVNSELLSQHRVKALHNLNGENWSFPLFFLGDQDAFNRLIHVHWRDHVRFLSIRYRLLQLVLHAFTSPPRVSLTPC